LKAFASVLSEQPLHGVPRKVYPMAVWEKYGLLSPRFSGAKAGDPRLSSLARETRFRMALEEGGGLLPLFGRYLAGRADLLPSPHLRELTRIRVSRASDARSVVELELGERVTDLQSVDTGAEWGACRGSFEGKAVVVEVYQTDESVREKAFKKLRREVRALSKQVEAKIAGAAVLDHFHEWLLLQGDIGRKRRLLENLAQIPSASICRYPRLVPELQSPACLVYDAMAGTPLDLDDSPGERNLRLLVEGLLDQSLFLSVVDADAGFKSYVALPDGHLGFTLVPSLAPVPLEWNYELLQYMACTVAGNSPRALQMLSRISSNTDPYAGEQHLMRELSGLQPELKINLITPESVTALENYWRALSNTRMRPPLFLELFHRQWTLIGQFNGDNAPSRDLVAEALWPVMSRILQLRMSGIMSVDQMQEWIGSSGLLALGATRQFGMALEQLRDDDLAVLTDHQEYDRRDARLNRRTMSLIRSGVVLGVFLLALQLTLSSRGGILQIAAGLAAVAAAAALSVFIARIE
jgi:hypothetical protein